MDSQKIKKTINKLVQAIESEDYEVVRAIFDLNIVNSVTDKSGEVFHLKGSETYINALKRMNFSKVRPKLSLTQISILDENQALFMIEVKAQKGEHKLHNHAAYLVKFKDEKIITMDMVEALPEYSDKFWNEY
jgi:hypothetical protein